MASVGTALKDTTVATAMAVATVIVVDIEVDTDIETDATTHFKGFSLMSASAKCFKGVFTAGMFTTGKFTTGLYKPSKDLQLVTTLQQYRRKAVAPHRPAFAQRALGLRGRSLSLALSRH